MLELHLTSAQIVSAAVALPVVVFFIVVSASRVLQQWPRRPRFRTMYLVGRRYRYRDFDLADPAQQLKAVMAASFQKRRVLSPSEYRAFKIIEDEVTAFGKGYRVFAQTCLGEILKSSDQPAFHSINSKRADILVIDGGGWPVLAIEYQGEGHYQSAAAARDAVKKEALRKAGVRHLEVHPTDSEDEIRSRLRGQIGWKRPTVASSAASSPAAAEP
jgi:hypothetical protein